MVVKISKAKCWYNGARFTWFMPTIGLKDLVFLELQLVLPCAKSLYYLQMQ